MAVLSRKVRVWENEWVEMCVCIYSDGDEGKGRE